MINRNDQGMMMPLVILLVVLLVFAGAAVTMAVTASWKSTLRVDADTEAANVLGAAENIVTTLATGDGQDPETACIVLHTDYTTAPPTPPVSCPTGAMDWTDWMPLPSRDGCAGTVLEGCWRAKFTEIAEAVQVTGRTTPLTLPVWTITIQAAARCDALPDNTLDNADELCVAVTGETVLTAETVTLPTYPTLLYSGLLWPPAEDPDTTDCAVDPTTATVWCAIPALARPPAGTQAQVSATDVVAGGIFINDFPTFACADYYCTIASGAADTQLARTVQSLPTDDLAADACTATPDVIAWTGPSGVAEVATAALPADIPPAGDPQMVVATGSITITDDIAAPATEPLLVVSGCHIIIDGRCTFGAIDPANPDSAPQACDGSALDLTVYDVNLGQRLPVTLTNVVIVTAGGVWAADLQPIGCAYDATAPTLIITGSVITGHAGATSLLDDCDNEQPLPTGQEAVIAGYERRSSLPTNAEAWATADIAWWPGREAGVWRRR